MNLSPTTVLEPVFHFLDGLLEENGVYFYLVFVWLSVLVLAWVFSGGLRRRFPINRTSLPARALSYSHTHHRHHQSSSTNLTRRMMARIKPGVL
jgi:hypothetical protein